MTRITGRRRFIANRCFYEGKRFCKLSYKFYCNISVNCEEMRSVGWPLLNTCSIVFCQLYFVCGNRMEIKPMDIENDCDIEKLILSNAWIPKKGPIYKLIYKTVQIDSIHLVHVHRRIPTGDLVFYSSPVMSKDKIIVL